MPDAAPAGEAKMAKTEPGNAANWTSQCPLCFTTVSGTEELVPEQVLNDHLQDCPSNPQKLQIQSESFGGAQGTLLTNETGASASLTMRHREPCDYKCIECGANYKTGAGLKSHMRSHITRVCQYCQKEIKASGKTKPGQMMQNHIRYCEKHPKNKLAKVRIGDKIVLKKSLPKEPTACKTCGREFHYPNKLKTHLDRGCQ